MCYCYMYNIHWGSLLAFQSYVFDSVLQYKVTDACEHVSINFKLILVPYHNVLKEPLSQGVQEEQSREQKHGE